MDRSEILVKLKRLKNTDILIEWDFFDNRHSGYLEPKITLISTYRESKGTEFHDETLKLHDFFLDEITEIIKQVKEEVDNRITNQESI